MNSALPLQAVNKSRTLLVTWLLSFVLAVLPVLLLWLVPRLRWRRLDYTWVMESGTPGWMIVFVVGSIGCVVLLVGVLLAFQNRKVTVRSRIGTALAVVFTLMLWGYWFYSTTTKAVTMAVAQPSGHAVKLTWKPSTSSVVGYNIYRSTSPHSFNEPPLNSGPVAENSYVDVTVESGRTYYYGVKSVDAHGNESDVSNVVPAKIP